MTSSASKRLFKEYRGLSSDPPEGITAGPVSEDDMFLWEALIQGPEGTPFEGGIFPAELKFPKDYPLAPPTMRFLTTVWHPNGTLDISTDKAVKAHSEVIRVHANKEQSTKTALSASQSCTLPVMTQITTSKPPSAGRLYRAWRRY
jgi:hypothetical protein